MLGFSLPGETHYNYTSALSSSYMKLFVNLETLLTFLNTSQTGFAHKSSGTDLSVFFKHLVTSLGLCLVQITLFCYFRTIFKFLYQPRCYYVPTDERMDPLPDGFFDWIIPTWRYDILYFLVMGLDTYFFLRFLSILLLFFSTFGVLNLLVLLPVNFFGGSETYHAPGLDRLSVSNIAITKVYRLNAHFVCCLISIAAFNIMIVYEMKSVVKIRQAYLGSALHKKAIPSRVILLSNIPEELRRKPLLESLFKVFPGGLEHIWFLDDFRKCSWQWKKGQDALEILEAAEVAYLKHVVRCRALEKPLKLFEPPNQFPPIYIHPVVIPWVDRIITIKLPGFLRALSFQKRTSVIDWSIETLMSTLDTLFKRKIQIAHDDYIKQSKVFLQFKTQKSAYMAHQSLLSLQQGAFNQSLIEVNPRDVLWGNLARDNTIFTSLERYLVSMLTVAIIVLYVVPVSFIGLLSQVPFMTELFPFMKWMGQLPEEVRDTLSSFLPSILLNILTGLQLVIFRRLIYFKGKLTGSELELDLQQWCFAFFFIQQFLVVSILSSIVVIFIQAVEKPTSIPLLLAANLPKGAIFFFKYLSVKAFALCGNNFLRIDQLVLHYISHSWKDITPRMKFRRFTTLPCVNWGSVYPAFSVYGAIGLTFFIISPLISVFMIFILQLVLLYYKYALRYIYGYGNVSETYGKLYPRALYHLYAGIYCLECCMVGIFFSLRNVHGDCPMKLQGLVMACVWLFTICGNTMVYAHFSKHFEYYPLFSDEDDASEPPAQTEHTNEWYLNEELMYSHPSYKYEKPHVWLPDDPFGEGNKEIKNLIKREGAFSGGSTRGASLQMKGKSATLHITEAPPVHK